MATVKSLQVENVKRIEKVVVSPRGYAVKVAGPNAAGKSSLIDAIRYTLEGRSAMDEMPIRDGQQKAKIVCDFGEFEITRSITQKGTTVTVKTEDGKVASPQKFIDGLLAGAATDAMYFFQKTVKEQSNIIGKVAGVDLAFFDEQIEELRADAKLARADLSASRATLNAFERPDPDTPDEEIDIAELREKQNQAFHARRKRRAAEEDLSQVERELKSLQEEIAQREQERANYLKVLDELPEPVDMEELDRQLRAANSLNEKIRVRVGYENTRKKVESETAKLEELSSAIDEAVAAKKSAIESADMPIVGISVDDEHGVCYKGVPINQISASEKIMVGVAVVSKLIPEDGLRVLRVKDASLIDSVGMETIEKLAELNKVQVWLELVRDADDQGNNTIFIRDGRAT